MPMRAASMSRSTSHCRVISELRGMGSALEKTIRSFRLQAEGTSGHGHRTTDLAQPPGPRPIHFSPVAPEAERVVTVGPDLATVPETGRTALALAADMTLVTMQATS